MLTLLTGCQLKVGVGPDPKQATHPGWMTGGMTTPTSMPKEGHRPSILEDAPVVAREPMEAWAPLEKDYRSLLPSIPSEGTIRGAEGSFASWAHKEKGTRAHLKLARGHNHVTLRLAHPVELRGVQGAGIRFQVEDPDSIVSFSVRYLGSAPNPEDGFMLRVRRVHKGWNVLRDFTSNRLPYPAFFKRSQGIVLEVKTKRPTRFVVGNAWVESPAKARILFIEDRGYKTFAQKGLPDLRALGIPVTWALDPALLGTKQGTRLAVIPQQDLHSYLLQGDAISFHSWDGSVTRNMTRQEILQDTQKAQRFLVREGLGSGRWRAAWTQNAAKNAKAAFPYLEACATPNERASLDGFPFLNRYDVPRVCLHGRSRMFMDVFFQQLQETHQLLVCYTHGIHPSGGNDITPSEWSYFTQKVRAGLQGGWLEGVTYESLAKEPRYVWPEGEDWFSDRSV